MADGFLGRWSRRKLDIQQGKPVEDPPQPAAPAEPAAAPVQVADDLAPVPTAAAQPAPTLDEVADLTPASDFTRFVREDVAPEVKNAAVKKLFADPHFNVMDGLDVYIDDYSRPKPLPEGVLRSLASTEFLDFFPDEVPARGEEPQPREVADDRLRVSVAQSAALPPAAMELPSQHADPDLRLQQDDAAGPEGPGRGGR